jgi:hypothetical protein
MVEADQARSLQAAVAVLDGVVFAARGALLTEPTLDGWRAGKDGPNAVSVHHRALSGFEGGEVEVETSTVEWTGKPSIVVRQLLGSDRPGPPVFPFASTVTKEATATRVAGRRRQVDLYRCGPRWIIALRSVGRYVTVTGRTIDPETVELVRLDQHGIEAALALTETRRRAFQDRMRADTEADDDG